MHAHLRTGWRPDDHDGDFEASSPVLIYERDSGIQSWRAEVSDDLTVHPQTDIGDGAHPWIDDRGHVRPGEAWCVMLVEVQGEEGLQQARLAYGQDRVVVYLLG